MKNASLLHWLANELDGAEKNLDAGWSLPNTLQENEELLSFEKEYVFEKGWTIAGRSDEWPTAGSRRVLTVGRTPVIVVRDRTGELHAFVNLCRHRGFPLVDPDTTRTSALLVCRYHGWSYDLQGKLVRAPGVEIGLGACDAAEQALNLTPVHLQMWRGFVFVNLSDSPSDLATEMLPADPAPQESLLSEYQVHHREIVYYDADWKRVYDNVVECYHCAGVHSRTLETMYRSDGFHDSGWRGRCRYATAELREFVATHHSIQMFPGNILFFDPVVGIIIRIVPLTINRTAQEVTFLSAPGADPAIVERYVNLWSETLSEDRSILAAQHLALTSGALPHSRLIQGREDSVIGAQKLMLKAYRDGLSRLSN